MLLDRRNLTQMMSFICPMYVLLDENGSIESVGPTLQKLRPDDPLPGQQFLEVFCLDRPRAVSSVTELLARSNSKLHLRLREPPHTGLKGALVRLPENGGAIVNLSFGISVLDAVSDFSLNAGDFSPTDLTIELLYLVEAKSAAMEASRKLNQRLQGAMIAAEEKAYTDTLTGLRNRRAMDYVLDRLIANGTRFSMMHMDLDYFKQVNDTMGHAAGDHVLETVARIMQEETRDSDTIARVGGDEFVLIFERLVDPRRLEAIAEKLILRIRTPIRFKEHVCEVSASIGTVVSPAAGKVEAEVLLAQADQALYAAKHAGRSCHRFYTQNTPLMQVTKAPGNAVNESRTSPDTGDDGQDTLRKNGDAQKGKAAVSQSEIARVAVNQNGNNANKPAAE